jgi:hypothetical protein
MPHGGDASDRPLRFATGSRFDAAVADQNNATSNNTSPAMLTAHTSVRR